MSQYVFGHGHSDPVGDWRKVIKYEGNKFFITKGEFFQDGNADDEWYKK